MPVRCADLAATWADLTTWLGERGVLMLPELCANQPVVRLDGDSGADPGELLRAIVDRFELRAVYVHQLRGEPDPTIITVRAVAGGVVHELVLCAAWYADLLDRTVGMEFAHRQ